MPNAKVKRSITRRSDRRGHAKNRGRTGNPHGATVIAELARGIACEREQLRHAIAEAAYHRAQRRGFAPGHELEDWLWAQEQILGERADIDEQVAHNGGKIS